LVGLLELLLPLELPPPGLNAGLGFAREGPPRANARGHRYRLGQPPLGGELTGLGQERAVFSPLQVGAPLAHLLLGFARKGAAGTNLAGGGDRPRQVSRLGLGLGLAKNGAVFGGFNLTAPAVNLGFGVLPGGVGARNFLGLDNGRLEIGHGAGQGHLPRPL
jgi:hypothetical protein